MGYTLTPNEVRRYENLLDFFHAELHSEFPTRIHSREVDDGSQWGAPAFHPSFIRWLGAEYEKLERGERPDGRTRMTRVLRKVRRAAPREYFVLQLVLANSMTISQAVERMNRRELEKADEAHRNGATWEEHVYVYDEVLVLLIAGLDKAYKWYAT